MAEEDWASKKKKIRQQFFYCCYLDSECFIMLTVPVGQDFGKDRDGGGRGGGAWLVPNTWCWRPQWGNAEAGGEQLGWGLGCGKDVHSWIWCPAGGANSRMPICRAYGRPLCMAQLPYSMGAPEEGWACVPPHTAELQCGSVIASWRQFLSQWWLAPWAPRNVAHQLWKVHILFCKIGVIIIASHA